MQTFDSKPAMRAAVAQWMTAVWERHGRPEPFDWNIATFRERDWFLECETTACGESFWCRIPLMAVINPDQTAGGEH